MNSSNLVMLNLGCGRELRDGWLHMDMSSDSSEVVIANFTKGIPLPDASVDVVYHSHVLEHLNPEDGSRFIAECYRVLKRGGILRVVVPNLEAIAIEYLECLNGALENSKDFEGRYDWMMLELYDQTVRNQPGGRMLKWLSREPLEAKEYVLGRIGSEALCWKALGGPKSSKLTFRAFFRAVRKNWFKFLPGRLGQVVAIGEFRLSGEIHQWMYDRFSLNRLIARHGFENIKQRTAESSQILNWSSYRLDRVDERASLFMEGEKL